MFDDLEDIDLYVDDLALYLQPENMTSSGPVARQCLRVR